MPTKFTFKVRLLLYSGIIIAIIISSFFWGSPGQSLNMRQARREFDSVRKELAGDPRFADLRMRQSTADLGRIIQVRGSVPDRASLEHLKSVIKKRMSPKFKVGFSVEVGEDSLVPAVHEEDKT
ncbi:MAG: hypothetical protein ACYS0H_04630 [Planctomycetota bacterium]|jgi:hypothetical protein